jgi:hypothetical protein
VSWENSTIKGVIYSIDLKVVEESLGKISKFKHKKKGPPF